MVRIIMTLLGLILLALGIWAAMAWWPAVKAVLLAIVALGLILLGAALVIFGISEIMGALPKKPPANRMP